MFSNIDRIAVNEIGGDGEVVSPVFNPVVRVAPMFLGVMSDLRQRMLSSGDARLMITVVLEFVEDDNRRTAANLLAKRFELQLI